MKVYRIDNVLHEVFYENMENTIIFNELMSELNKTKELIDTDPNKWSYCKKSINKYEYVYTSSFSNNNICVKKPISRSYFKILEIVKYFKLDKFHYIDCIAEAPGGFIEYFNELKCSINAISLISSNKSIPHWNRSIHNSKNIKIFSGVDNTGDIYKLENIIHYVKHSGKNKRDLVTGDGGFDYTINFNKQELDSYPLIYSEVLMAHLLLKTNGVFICKIFDIMYSKTIKILYLLNINFKKVYIVKPSMSRDTNSEKYIVCIGYKGYNLKQINMLIHNFQKEIDIQVPKKFISIISNINNIYTKNQISEIKRGINMIKNNKIVKYPSNEQIIIGEKWCKENGLELNRAFRYRTLYKR